MTEKANYLKQKTRFDALYNGFRPDDVVTSGPDRINPNSVLVNLNAVVQEPVLSALDHVISNLNDRVAGHHKPELKHHLTIRAIADMATPLNSTLLNFWSNETDKILKDHRPFEVEVRGISTFPNVAFARVYVPQEFWDLHDKLLKAMPSRNPNREGSAMVPHLSLMYYEQDPTELLKLLRKYEDYYFGRFKISGFRLEGRQINLDGHNYYQFSEFSLQE